MKARYYLQIDILKAFAIIAVVIMHSFDKLTSTVISNEQTSSIAVHSLTSTSIIQINHISLLVIIESVKIFTLWQAIPIFFIIMGITLGMSFKRHNYTSLKDIYSKNYFKSRFIRLYFPYILLLLITFILGVLIFLTTNINQFGNLSLYTIVGFIPLKGPNYGSYFITLVLQVVFVFPLIYMAYMKNPKLILISAAIFDITFQIVAYYYLNSLLYSLCIVRFISALIIGLWISDQDFDFENPLNRLSKLKNFVITNKLLLYLSIIGIIYLTIWYFLYEGYLTSSFYPIPYLNNNFGIFGCQNVLSFVYTAFLISLGFLIFPNNFKSRILNKIGIIGKASYHIFLIQILYFTLFSMSNFINPITLLNKILIIFGDIILCVLLGVMFYYLEQKFSSILFNY